MIALLKAYWLELLISTCCVMAGYGVAQIFNQAHIESLKAELAGVKAGYAEKKAQAATASLARIQLANQRADALQVALDTTEQRLTITQTEMNREIQRHTTGRACLNSSTVRLLNHEAAGNPPATVSTPASGPAADDAALATDTDVATWASNAIVQYNTCRARLNTLIAWHAPNTTAAESTDD